MQERFRLFYSSNPTFETFTTIALSASVGLALGALIVLTSGLSSTWRGLLLLSVPALTILMIVNTPYKTLLGPKRTLLALIMLAVPISLDFSLIIVVPPQDKVALSELRLSVATVVLILGYASWLLASPRVSKRGGGVRFFTGTSVPALGLILAAILSTFSSKDVRLSLFLIVQLCELFLIYLFVANYIKTYNDLEFVLTVASLLLLVESAFILFQKFTGFTFGFGGLSGVIVGNRIAGTLESPNNAGAYLATNLPIAFSLFLVTKAPHKKYLSAAAMFVGAMALIAPLSRGAWQGFLIAMSFIVFIGLLKRWMRLKDIAPMVLILLVTILLFYGQISKRLTADDGGSAESRSVLNTLAMNMIKDKPIFGVGANTFALWSDHYVTPDIAPLGWLARAPVHNKYLLVWAETGIVGLFFWVLLLLSALLRGVLWIRSMDKTKGIVALGLTGALLAISSHLMADHLLNRSITLMVWLVIAMLSSLDELSSTQSNTQPD
jgi:O-antigen ligase